jgi:hypothetical protein
MTELTDQDYFDKTVKHIIAQGDACKNKSGSCVYRNGSKSCAVGYWIPEGHPAESETGSVDSLVDTYPDLKGVAWPDTEHGVYLALELQRLHDDNIVGTEAFEKGVACIKSEFKQVGILL